MNQTEHLHHQYPAAMVNITNRCTLSCKHCFIYRENNPNDRRAEMDTPTMLRKLADLQKRHGIQHMLWMGGEPLLRPDVLRKGVALFSANTVTTNGTLDPIDLPDCNYVISIETTCAAPLSRRRRIRDSLLLPRQRRKLRPLRILGRFPSGCQARTRK